MPTTVNQCPPIQTWVGSEVGDAEQAGCFGAEHDRRVVGGRGVEEGAVGERCAEGGREVASVAVSEMPSVSIAGTSGVR